MKRRRLRPAHSPEELAEIYAAPHDSSRWRDHDVRVEVTVAVARGIEGVKSVADLSCGDGRIARAIAYQKPTSDVDRIELHLGDFAPGYDYRGSIEQTVHEIPDVDLFICSETVEHLDDPDTVLAAVRGKAAHLLLSTPVGAFDDQNLEHYWAWDREAVEKMLRQGGFAAEAYCELSMHEWSPYSFGIWACR